MVSVCNTLCLYMPLDGGCCSKYTSTFTCLLIRIIFISSFVLFSFHQIALRTETSFVHKSSNKNQAYFIPPNLWHRLKFVITNFILLLFLCSLYICLPLCPFPFPSYFPLIQHPLSSFLPTCLLAPLLFYLLRLASFSFSILPFVSLHTVYLYHTLILSLFLPFFSLPFCILFFLNSFF